MDLIRLGRAHRGIRLHLRLRQADVAERAAVSQQLVSKLELGRAGEMTLDEVDRLTRALDARVVVSVPWRGGDLDRLLDEDHSAVVSFVAALLRPDGWEVLSEVTYAVFGERGSIDLLAWHAATRTLLVVEVKTEITSAEETLRRHDAKVRLAASIGRERFGVAPAAVARLLVVADTSRNRRRVARLAGILDGQYRLRGHAVREWLARPSGATSGLMFASTTRGGVASQPVRPRRVRRPPNTTMGGA